MNDLLARPGGDLSWTRVAEFQRLAEELERIADPDRRFGLHQCAELGCRCVHGFRPDGHRHAFPGTHRVDRHWKRRHHAVDRRLFKKERLAAARRFHFAVGDFGDFKFGGDRDFDPLEFARFFECDDEFRKRRVSHGGVIAGRLRWRQSLSEGDFRGDGSYKSYTTYGTYGTYVGDSAYTATGMKSMPSTHHS